VQKFGERVMGRGQKMAFFVYRRTGWPCTMTCRLGTVMGTHTGAGKQCVDAVEIGIGVDGWARILHTGMGSGGLWRAKSGMGLPT